MSGKNKFIARPVSSSCNPITFDEKQCVGCNRCVSICQVDILIPSKSKGEPPIVLYPGECYYCGACVMECPREGAIQLSHPIMNRTKFTDVC